MTEWNIKRNGLQPCLLGHKLPGRRERKRNNIVPGDLVQCANCSEWFEWRITRHGYHYWVGVVIGP